MEALDDHWNIQNYFYIPNNPDCQKYVWSQNILTSTAHDTGLLFIFFLHQKLKNKLSCQKEAELWAVVKDEAELKASLTIAITFQTEVGTGFKVPGGKLGHLFNT